AADISLRGTMRPADAGSTGAALLTWQPAGALAAVPLEPRENITITRSPLDDEISGQQVSLSQARVYLSDDEILAGRLLSVSPAKTLCQSRVTGRIEIPATHLRALDTGMAGRILEGFKDSEWEEIEEIPDQVVVTGAKVV